VGGEPVLDLNYAEDVEAEVDFNVVMNEQLEMIEIQGTGESGSFSRQQLNGMLDVAEIGIEQLLAAQRQALNIQSAS